MNRRNSRLLNLPTSVGIVPLMDVLSNKTVSKCNSNPISLGTGPERLGLLSKGNSLEVLDYIQAQSVSFLGLGCQ